MGHGMAHCPSIQAQYAKCICLLIVAAVIVIAVVGGVAPI